MILMNFVDDDDDDDDDHHHHHHHHLQLQGSPHMACSDSEL
jgi:hypothetical protein